MAEKENTEGVEMDKHRAELIKIKAGLERRGALVS
jgi:hypothetical protein